MELIAIDLNQGNNREYYWGKSRKYRKEWSNLIEDKHNHYDAVEFFKAFGSHPIGYKVLTIGKPTTIQEALIQRIYSNDAKYEEMRQIAPEDLVESRISWGELRGYADDMAVFINELIYMI